MVRKHKHPSPDTIPFQLFLDALRNENETLQARFLYRLSDMPSKELHKLEKHWPEIPLWRRQAMMEDLLELAENDYLLSYEGVARLALEDDDPRVRGGGIQILIVSESDARDLIGKFLNLVETDPDIDVRAFAASALARFIFEGEMDELPKNQQTALEDRLFVALATEKALLVQRRITESLSYSSRDEVNKLIETASRSEDLSWIVTALLAMGRSADESWNEYVLSHLAHNNAAIRLEAARAAGELDIKDARKHLFELVEDFDEKVRDAAIWSLSQIGGVGVKTLIKKKLKSAEDDDEVAFFKGALENLDFTEDLDAIALLATQPMTGDETDELYLNRSYQEDDDEDDEEEEKDFLPFFPTDGVWEEDDDDSEDKDLEGETNSDEDTND